MTTNTAPTCRECGAPGRYTIDGVTLCTAHRGLLPRFVCGAAYAPGYDYTCTLPPHGPKVDHEDHVSDAPNVLAWRLA